MDGNDSPENANAPEPSRNPYKGKNIFEIRKIARKQKGETSSESNTPELLSIEQKAAADLVKMEASIIDSVRLFTPVDDEIQRINGLVIYHWNDSITVKDMEFNHDLPTDEDIEESRMYVPGIAALNHNKSSDPEKNTLGVKTNSALYVSAQAGEEALGHYMQLIQEQNPHVSLMNPEDGFGFTYYFDENGNFAKRVKKAVEKTFKAVRPHDDVMTMQPGDFEVARQALTSMSEKLKSGLQHS